MEGQTGKQQQFTDPDVDKSIHYTFSPVTWSTWYKIIQINFVPSISPNLPATPATASIVGNFSEWFEIHAHERPTGVYRLVNTIIKTHNGHPRCFQFSEQSLFFYKTTTTVRISTRHNWHKPSDWIPLIGILDLHKSFNNWVVCELRNASSNKYRDSGVRWIDGVGAFLISKNKINAIMITLLCNEKSRTNL